jgi:preprotein translocase subunit SecE
MNNLVYVLLFVAVAALVVWAVRKHFFRHVRIFVGEMVGELQKAAWPTRSELRDSTIVVIAAAVILGVFTSISDFALYNFVDLYTRMMS